MSADAFRHAQQIVDAEKFLGLYHEHSIQQAFLRVDWFMAFWNIWYGTIHFVMPVVALVWLYRKLPARYVRWRNTLVLMLGVSLLGVLAVPAHAAAPDARALRLRRHRRRLLQLRTAGARAPRRERPAVGGGRPHLRQPVRGDAEPARGVVDVVGARGVAAAAAPVGEGALGALPRQHLLLHRGDRQPLDPRRGRWVGRARDRLPRRRGIEWLLARRRAARRALDDRDRSD